MLNAGPELRCAARRLAAALLFGGSVAAVVILLGTRDLESYEHVFFSLDRGTAIEAIHVLGHPVYTLAVGLGVRLPLQGSLEASPAARLAAYLPAPLTYWLLMGLTIAAAVLLVRQALEPLCGRLMSWIAVLLLFFSVPMVAYTIYGDWPEVAVTYCASVGCVFAPHALLTLLDAEPSARRARRLAVVSVFGAVWGLVALSHPGYWPLIAAALVLTGILALLRSDYSLRTRLTAVVVVAAASCTAVALQAPDIARELAALNDATGMRRFVDAPRRNLVAANLFPFGQTDPEIPFAFLVLALVSLLIGLTSTGIHLRRLVLGSAIASAVLSVGAATLSLGSSPYAPSSVWALRDPAAAFAVLAAAGAATVLGTSRGISRSLGTRVAVAALVIAGLQGPALATSFILTGFPRLADHRPWTHDLTAPSERVARRGLSPDRVPPGVRLALWPEVRGMMRNARQPSTDFADAGYLLATAWTKQRTMRNLVEPNEWLFDQNTDLSAEVLCNAQAVRFLQLRYLLRPATATACAPWATLPDVQVDNWLAVDITRETDDRVWALPAARLAEPLSREPALSAGSTLIPALAPLAGTALTIQASGVALHLDDPSAATGQALVLPVAYDAAWHASAGQVHNVGGLLALVGVNQPQVQLTFVPDLVAVLRAVAMTLAQVLAVAGLLGLAYVVPAPAEDGLLRQLQAVAARVAASRVAAVVRKRRNWAYLAFSLALVPLAVWPPDEAAARTALVAAALLPLTALAVARLARWEPLRRAGGAALLTLTLVHVAAGGSRAATAVHDPIFWAGVGAGALGISALIGRWPVAAWIAAAGGGAAVAVALLLPAFPGFASTFPTPTLALVRASFRIFADQFGVLAAVLLPVLWLQALVGGRGSGTGRIDAAVRGALLAGLLLAICGILPQGGAEPSMMTALGVVLGLAEAKARQQR